MDNKLKYFNLYKMGPRGWFHITSVAAPDFKTAVKHFQKEADIKLGRKVGRYKVSGL